MHDTPHETTEAVIPVETSPIPGSIPSDRGGHRSPTPAEVAVKLIGMVDEFERLFRDPRQAWAALEGEIERRAARWESRHSAGEPEPVASVRREPRPFAGFDREQATYARCKPSLLESAEGKWIVIVGEEVIGPFEEIADAERAGLKQFGLGPLYIKQVLAQEPPPIILPHSVAIPCRT